MENQQIRQKRDVLTKRMKEFLIIFKKNAGRIQASCEKAKQNRSTYYAWLEKSPKFKKGCYEAIENLKDFVEGKILTHIKSPDNKISADMCKFYAKTKMRDRGYVEKQELDVSDNRTRIVIEKADNGNNKVETKPEAGAGPGDPK